MVNFSSLEFLFRFLPIFLAVYFVVPSRYREVVFLVGSILFYAVGEPVFIVVFLLAALLNYLFIRSSFKVGEGFRLHKWQKRVRKKYLIGAVLLDVALLVLFKILGTFVDASLLPLGISFYIFKMISLQADVYLGKISKNPGLKRVMLYFSMFPQLTSGPIMRYEEAGFDFREKWSVEKLEEGLKYFAAGLGMKVLLADRLAILWNDLQMIGFQSISTPLAWMGAAGYSLQLYFDFWGYSLMASGLMVMLGYEYIENFSHPYASVSIGEFYRRWHMTLGSWFRDYVYIPLGGSRCSKARLVFNLAAVWLLTGLWHGNGWNFLIWGALLGMLVILEKLFYGKWLQKYSVVGRLYVLFVIPLTWVVFAITDLRQLGTYLGRMFPFVNNGVSVNQQDFIQYGQSYGIFFLVGIVLCIPAVMRFFEKHRKHPLMLLFLLLIFWGSVSMLSQSAGNPFMYLNF